MGWNQGYTIFEATVIGAYDIGVLNRKLLTVLMNPYRGSDIDSGGSHDLRTHDGKGVEQVVIETFGGKAPKKPGPNATDQEREDYYEALGEKFNKITRDKFNWR